MGASRWVHRLGPSQCELTTRTVDSFDGPPARFDTSAPWRIRFGERIIPRGALEGRQVFRVVPSTRRRRDDVDGGRRVASSAKTGATTDLMWRAEWEFIQGLQYQAQTGEDADFVRMMYTVRLKKVRPTSIARQS